MRIIRSVVLPVFVLSALSLVVATFSPSLTLAQTQSEVSSPPSKDDIIRLLATALTQLTKQIDEENAASDGSRTDAETSVLTSDSVTALLNGTTEAPSPPLPETQQDGALSNGDRSADQQPSDAEAGTQRSTVSTDDMAHDDVVDLLAKALDDLNEQPHAAVPGAELQSPLPHEPSADNGSGPAGDEGTAPDLMIAAFLEASHKNREMLRRYNGDPTIDTPIGNVRRQAFPILTGDMIHFADLYFDANSSGLSPAAIRRLEETAHWIRLMPDVEQITILSQTDSRGSSLLNRDVSEDRAREVARYLREAGLTTVAMNIEALGESHLIEQTDDGVSEPLNRVVSIWGHR